MKQKGESFGIRPSDSPLILTPLPSYRFYLGFNRAKQLPPLPFFPRDATTEVPPSPRFVV